MPQSESIANLAKALALAQTELKPVKKEAENPFFKSRYADLAAVWEALKPFHAHGIAITQMTFDAGEGYIGLMTQLSHESGEWINSSLKLPLQKEDPQGVGSAITYARRYALGCMTGVVTEEDDDGNAASQASPAKAHTASKATAAKKIAEIRKEEPQLEWELFLDYMADDPERTKIGKELKDILRVAKVADLKGDARVGFIKQFQASCKDMGVPCEEWVK